jgi:hypothetical protein
MVTGPETIAVFQYYSRFDGIIVGQIRVEKSMLDDPLLSRRQYQE